MGGDGNASTAAGREPRARGNAVEVGEDGPGTATLAGVFAARPWPAVEWQAQQRGFLLAFSSCRHGRVETHARAGPTFQWKKAQGTKPCAGFPPPSEGGALSGSAPAVCYAVWKAAISTAADLRDTLAAAGVLAS